MSHEILMLGPLGPIERALALEFTVHKYWLETDREGFLREVGPRIHGAVAFTGAVPADAALIAALPNLAIITNMGVGYDSVDVEAAKARGIIVTNAGAVNAIDVAELAFGLLLDVARGISMADRYVRAGRWQSDGRMKPTRRLNGRRLGILGLGNIGHALAVRAAAFDMPIAYHNRSPRPDAPYRYCGSVVELATESDILVIATPGGEQTRHLVGRAELNALGPQGILINVARGSVVDELALIDALAEGRLGGAGLDVFEAEPHVPARLLELPNVVVNPHGGGATYEAIGAAIDVVIENMKAYFSGGTVINRIA